MAPDHGFLLAFLVICSTSMLFQVAEVKAEASGKDWENQCAFFTFVEKDFLSFNKMKFSTCNESYVIPMIHEWAVGNTSCDKATESLDEYVCGHNTHCVDYYPVQGYRCECNNGYGGNPYLPQSCQDVDECSNPEDNNCPMETHCVNTKGSYFCLPNRTRMLELLTPLGTGLGVGLLILVAIGIWTWTKLKQIKEKQNEAEIFQEKWGSTTATADIVKQGKCTT
ncbi:Wall-associated receptor kinase [Sesamum angolense]|uniref:Wall-associated receptor kinase n=1 Tax=Sesamum angolense TaxID=2727404 RepID=A0AAE1WVH2_9LAMI|nr:Wall-associated receptor kinase [Sesamum angolense]